MAMVVTLEAVVIGLPILFLANGEPTPGFIIKSFCCILIPGATVGLIFFPKVAMAYGWGLRPEDSNPWRFVKGDSGLGSNPSKKVMSNADSNFASNNQSKIKMCVHPSLNSIVEGKVVVTMGNDVSKQGNQAANPVFSSEHVTVSQPSMIGAAIRKAPTKQSNKELSSTSASTSHR